MQIKKALPGLAGAGQKNFSTYSNAEIVCFKYLCEVAKPGAIYGGNFGKCKFLY